MNVTKSEQKQIDRATLQGRGALLRALAIIYRRLSVGQKGGPSSGGCIEITDSERSYSLIVLGWLRRRSR